MPSCESTAITVKTIIAHLVTADIAPAACSWLALTTLSTNRKRNSQPRGLRGNIAAATTTFPAYPRTSVYKNVLTWSRPKISAAATKLQEEEPFYYPGAKSGRKFPTTLSAKAPDPAGLPGVNFNRFQYF